MHALNGTLITHSADAAAPMWRRWSDPLRAITEFAATSVKPARRSRAPAPRLHAEARSVMVLPGFMVGDWSTSVLRGYLGLHGYAAAPWGFGRNRGPVNNLLERLTERVQDWADSLGERVNLVGHSLGGIYAREIARALPDTVRLVVTLGSPFRFGDDGQGASPTVVKMLEFSTGRTVRELKEQCGFRYMDQPLPVHSVAIYSKEDTIAHWRYCINDLAPHAENVEVQGSHSGMVVNPSVLGVVADRLARVVH